MVVQARQPSLSAILQESSKKNIFVSISAPHSSLLRVFFCQLLWELKYIPSNFTLTVDLLYSIAGILLVRYDVVSAFRHELTHPKEKFGGLRDGY